MNILAAEVKILSSAELTGNVFLNVYGQFLRKNIVLKTFFTYLPLFTFVYSKPENRTSSKDFYL